jgi:drug/metabolite transporter (DMT)-like permease
LVTAVVGLGVLVIPRAGGDVSVLGIVTMIGAGVAWGVYSLRGRDASHPLAATADNFARALPMAAVASAVGAWRHDAFVSGSGVLLAVASGAVASGIGYSVWYAALRGLTATRAAILQLAVPVIAAVGGVVVLGEQPTMRLAGAALLILGGVGIAVVTPRV